jgi:hypothetical protein
MVEIIDISKLDLEKARIFVEKEENEFLILKGINNQKRWKLRKVLPARLTSQMIGFWFGDGDKVRSIGITNTKLELVRKFLDFTDTLGLPRDRFLLEIKLKKDSEIDMKKVSEELKIPEERMRIRGSELATKPCFRVRLFSRVISRLFKILADWISNSSKDLKIEFLKGLIAAEGCVSLRKDGKIHEIFISLKNKNEKEWIKRNFLEAIGITHIRENKDSIVIGRKENFNIIFSLNLMGLHEEKFKKFISSFSLF